MIPIARPIIGKEEIEAVKKVLESGIITQGPVAGTFEREFAKFIGSKNAIVTDSGTSALHTSLLAHNIKQGDEVIIPSFSFIATANSILHANVKPIFIDVEEDSFNLNPELIQESITKKTKAIMPVHLYGNPANMPEITKIATDNNLIVIEDACQSHGAEINGKKVGSFFTGCFSFHPTKNMTTGKGGIITTNNDEIAEKAKLIALCGEREKKYYGILGYNYRLTDIQAAIGLKQLKKLPSFNEKRIQNASFFNKNISIEGIILPKVKPNYKHVFHQYTIRITPNCKKTREEIIKILQHNKIGHGIYYPLPIHKQKLYQDLGYNINLPISEKLSQEVLSLPIHPSLKEEDLNKIVEVMNQI